ncbi:C_GCAxxG_C_C family probable redox protein [Clostridium moniliforme]|uniref:C_GCAxxG_C_C family probable redox protein n=1 Tax=Clostridium moniliforme TaxID=39489 RepID=A0ABS4F2F0_9CLOT|nr:C-GCAxxG-C-C family (seleno)protein [Clostridium moniliforme]MBP1890412.1 C_GCAxxG_C_C family probable redox protein [Clostridium moniliforme]
MDKNELKRIRETAEKYYRDGDFFCSEAIVKTLKDEFMPELSDDVVKMASGFPVGIGRTGCTCGALTGGILVLGMIFGRSEARGQESAKVLELSKELHDKFVEMNKCTCCRVLTKGMVKGSKEHKDQCVRFTGEMAEETAKIIIREKEL